MLSVRNSRSLFSLLAPVGLMAGLWLLMGAYSPRCDICGQSIRGQYYTAGTKTICTSCMAHYPRCAGCGIPVRSSFGRYQGRPVCRDCTARAGRCANCGDVLLGRYVEAKGVYGKYCETCMSTKPKCLRCGLPVPRLVDAGNGGLCPSCAKLVPHCSACNLPLLGKYYEIEFLSGRYCQNCYENRPHCDFCGRPIVQGWTDFMDGRRSCNICSATAVSNVDQARDLLAATVRFMDVQLNMGSRIPFDFALVDNNEIAKLNNRKNNGEVKELGLYLTRRGSRPLIAILDGLPKAAFLETAAHEYAHHWQIQANPGLQDLRAIEGFAQWSAGEWLIRNKLYSSNARLAKVKSPVYGEGYRIMKQYADAKGAPAMVRDILRVRGDHVSVGPGGLAGDAPSVGAIPYLAARPRGDAATTSAPLASFLPTGLGPNQATLFDPSRPSTMPAPVVTVTR